MMRRFVFLGILCFWNLFALAQKPFSLLDTFQIGEVVSVGKLKQYQSGAKIESIGNEFILLQEQGGIENLLKRFTPIYIKSDAGGLSTIRFRGTSPNHTAINFGGINLNSLTLGHSNLSIIPTFLFDEIGLQFGSSSSVNGSGAIGGALYLGLNEKWTDGFNLQVKSMVGSFGEKQAGTKIIAGNGKWKSGTRAYFYQKENDFPFLNVYTGDITRKNGIEDVQKGAALKNYGILQELNYRFSENEYFKSMIWFSNSWRQVQPNMQSNYQFKGTQEIDDRNLRVWAEYENKKQLVNFKIASGYVFDYQIFDDIDEQIIQTDRFLFEVQASAKLFNGLGLKTGAKYKYIIPNVHAYSDSVISFEEHFDVYFSSFYQLRQNLKLTLNLRQTFVSNFTAPFTPSLGAEYVLRTGENSFLKITSALAKSYRVPTLNDRFWGVQGNPELKPEKGKNIELGTEYVLINNNCNTRFGINAFYMKVDDWIEWRNFGVWKAKNVQQVVSKGIEFKINSCFQVLKSEVETGINYTFNPVEAVKTNDETGIVNRQMNYVPKQMGNGFFSVKRNKFVFVVDGQFTGRRFTDDFGDKLPNYFIANSTVYYKLIKNKNTFNFSFTVQNFLNKNYQNEKYYAMPGRAFQLGLKYDVLITQK